MIVGQAGFAAAGKGSSFPPNGTLLSQSCEPWSGTDATNYSYSGNYLSTRVYANGTGGTYTETGLGADGCHLPYGFHFTSESTTNSLSWSGCSSSGTLANAYSDYSYSYADGEGGTISDSGTSWDTTTYPDGMVIYDDGAGCVVTVTADGSGSHGFYDVSTVSCPAYETKVGTPYWDGTSGLLQDYADGTCGTFSLPWDGNPPCPVYGVQIGTPSNETNSILDAMGDYRDVYVTTTPRANGSCGSYGDVVSTYPYQWAYSVGVFMDETVASSWFDDEANQIYAWLYGATRQAEGDQGTTYKDYLQAPFGTTLSGGFIYGGSPSELRADGTGGYFVYNT